MAKNNQWTPPSAEREISVDLNAADADKAVTRRPADIGREVRERDADGGRTPAEKQLFRRMGRLERNLTKQFDQQAAEREAAWQREKSDLQAKIDKLSVERGGDDKADAAHEAAIAVLKAKLEAAMEKGDSKESADITLQISRLDAKFWADKARVAGVATRETAADPNAGKTTQPARRQSPTAAGSRFITANEDWWEDPEYEAENATVNTIYLRLVNQEGFDPKSGETFKEVAKQLKKKFPDLDVKSGVRGAAGPGDDDDDDDDAAAAGNGGRRNAASQRIDDRGAADAQGARRDGNRRVLTAQDKKTMRDCRLDPDDDRDVVQFLREAVAMEDAQ